MELKAPDDKPWPQPEEAPRMDIKTSIIDFRLGFIPKDLRDRVVLDPKIEMSFVNSLKHAEPGSYVENPSTGWRHFVDGRFKISGTCKMIVRVQNVGGELETLRLGPVNVCLDAPTSVIKVSRWPQAGISVDMKHQTIIMLQRKTVPESFHMRPFWKIFLVRGFWCLDAPSPQSRDKSLTSKTPKAEATTSLEKKIAGLFSSADITAMSQRLHSLELDDFQKATVKRIMDLSGANLEAKAGEHSETETKPEDEVKLVPGVKRSFLGYMNSQLGWD